MFCLPALRGLRPGGPALVCSSSHCSRRARPLPAVRRTRCQAAVKHELPRTEPASAQSRSGSDGAQPPAQDGDAAAQTAELAAAQTAELAAAQAAELEEQPEKRKLPQTPPEWWRSPRNLALGGSVAAVLLLTLFRRELAPVVRWMVMQAGNLSDKSVLGEGPSPEAIATGLAVGLTLWFSFVEFQRSSERMKALEALEVALEEKSAVAEARLRAMEERLGAAAAEDSTAGAAADLAAPAAPEAAHVQALVRRVEALEARVAELERRERP